MTEEMMTSLSKPLSNCPTPIYADAGSETFQTNVTKLSDGLTVASQPKFGTFCTVGSMLMLFFFHILAIRYNLQQLSDFNSGIIATTEVLQFLSTLSL